MSLTRWLLTFCAANALVPWQAKKQGGPRGHLGGKCMSTAREIRRRLRSIKNIAKMTKAMQVVASSKLRSAQQRAQQSRPYAARLRTLVSHLAYAIGEDGGEGLELLRQRLVHNIGVIVITPDRHLYGVLPGTINRKAIMIAREHTLPCKRRVKRKTRLFRRKSFHQSGIP